MEGIQYFFLATLKDRIKKQHFKGSQVYIKQFHMYDLSKVEYFKKVSVAILVKATH
jgi:hypothetical protein